MPVSAIDAISPAFQHTKQQLFQPFRAGQWTRLALVGLLAGELTTGSCNSFNTHVQAPRHPQQLVAAPLPNIDPGLLVLLVAFLLTLGFVFWLLFLYINSVMRFILFDSVIERNCRIRAGWNRRQGPGLRYFVWQILFTLAIAAGFVILIAFPAALAFAAGWLTKPKEHLPLLILFGMLLFLVILACGLLAAVILVFTKDFVVPQMAIEDLSAFQAWARLLRMLDSEKGPYFGYVLMKIVMALGVGIVVGILTTVVILVTLIPIGGLGALFVFAGKAAGFSWNLYTITVVVVVGCIVLAAILYIVSLVSVPAMVFFPAYAIYFFASRYPALDALIHPAPASPLPMPAVTPLQPEVTGSG